MKSLLTYIYTHPLTHTCRESNSSNPPESHMHPHRYFLQHNDPHYYVNLQICECIYLYICIYVHLYIHILIRTAEGLERACTDLRCSHMKESGTNESLDIRTSGGPGRACTNLSWSAKKVSRALNNLNRPSDTKSLSNPCCIIESWHLHACHVFDCHIFFRHEIFFEKGT